MKLEIGVRLHPHDAGGIGPKPRRRQPSARQIDFDVARLADPQVARGVERIRLGENPALRVERKPRDVARGAADALERVLACEHGALDGGIARDHAAGHLERCLPDRHRRHVGARQLVGEAVAVGIGIASEPLGRLDAVMLVVRRVRELAQRDDVARLMPGPDDERRRARLADREEAQPAEPFDVRGIPHAIASEREPSERNPFRDERLCLAEMNRVARPLQLLGDLPRQHLEIPGTKHCGRRPEIGGALQRHARAALVDRAARRERVGRIERREVEALAENEDVRHDVAAAAGDAVRRVVAAGAGVRVGRRHAVERADAAQRLRRIGEGPAGPFRQRAAAALLLRPFRLEEQLAVLEQRGERQRVLLAVLEMRRHRDLATDRGRRDPIAVARRRDVEAKDGKEHGDDRREANAAHLTTSSVKGFVALAAA